jgi:hypothetical protein
MGLLQQCRSIVIHGFRLAFFVPASRNAFDVSCIAIAIILALIGSVWAGLDLWTMSAHGETLRLFDWLFFGLAGLVRPFVYSAGVAGLGRALSRRLPFRMLLATLAGTMWVPDLAWLLFERMNQYLEADLAKSSWNEFITSAMFGYFGLLILHLSLIAWIALILYRSVRLIAGPPAAGLALSIIAILSAVVLAFGLIATS